MSETATKRKLGRAMIVAVLFVFLLISIENKFPASPTETTQTGDANHKSLLLIWEDSTFGTTVVDLRIVTIVQIFLIFASTIGALHQFAYQIQTLKKGDKPVKEVSS